MERILKWNERVIKLLSNRIFYVSAVSLLAVVAIVQLHFAWKDLEVSDGNYFEMISKLQAGEWFLILIFPLAPLFSYLLNRNKAFGDPAWNSLLIGFCWSGIMTVYPVLFFGLMNHFNYDPGWMMGLMFLTNFVLMSVLSYVFMSSKFDDRKLHLK